MFLTKANESIGYHDGHYVLPLPFRESNVMMPNKDQAAKRAIWQRKKMLRDENYRKDYVNFVNGVIAKGYAQKVFLEQNLERCGTYHTMVLIAPRNPGKFALFFTAVQSIKVHHETND